MAPRVLRPCPTQAAAGPEQVQPVPPVPHLTFSSQAPVRLPLTSLVPLALFLSRSLFLLESGPSPKAAGANDLVNEWRHSGVYVHL